MDRKIRFGGRVQLGKAEPFSKIIERSALFEKYDFDTVLVDDHLLYGTESAQALDPFSTATRILGATDHLQVLVAVTDMVRRHPAIVTQSAGTINSMAPGRFVLGLGAGDPMNQAPFGFPVDHRFERFREGVKIMKLLFQSSFQDPVTYSGAFHQLTSAYLQGGSTPPLYFAAFGEKMLNLTGQLADGWIPHCHTPESYKRDLDKILASAGRVGRRERSFHPSYYTSISVSSERQVADRDVLGSARYFLALIPEALKKLDPSAEHPGRIWENVHDPRQQRKIISTIASRIPEQVALSTAIHGTPSDCIEQISRYVEHGCQEIHLMFIAPHGLWSGDAALPMVRLFSEKVIEYFRDGLSERET